MIDNIIRFPSRRRRRVKPPVGVDPRYKIDIYQPAADLVGVNIVASLEIACDVLALLNRKHIA